MPELFNQISRYNKIRMGCHQFTARTYGPILNINISRIVLHGDITGKLSILIGQ